MLDALSEVLEGKNVDCRFAARIDREPELPESCANSLGVGPRLSSVKQLSIHGTVGNRS